MLVLIVGITGDLGQRLAHAALARGLRVRGLGRNPSKVKAEITPKLESFVVSKAYYDITAIDEAMSGVDAIICAYSMDPVLYLDGGLLMLRAAERAGVKIFVAPTWTSNWTNIKYGDFEIYDSIIAFADQAARTSTIRPVYIINGAFAEYTLASLASGVQTFETDGKTAKLHYWGNVAKQKLPWTTMDDSAAWTIELLMNNKAILGGKGGIFQFQSGFNSYEELAKIYQDVTGVKVSLVCEGNVAELEKALAHARKEKGKERFLEYLYLAWSRIAVEGLWQLQSPINLSHAKQPTTFEEHLRARSNKM
ncbi:hypothetical protein HIM_08820 [Hirsutella minnesotensis 3608]|uniref:NmrA-like domain-containing protein n=1 Tax=Hirsutella minnesotensis 3608 TaxID=1043627 RepID=A0A0F7ZM84_9HYPO|nr:hypothetical protein HIM_08820 [Hirsutella minnesotensis 3608]